MPIWMVRYIEHEEFGSNADLRRIFTLISSGDERTEVRSCWEDEPVDEIFLNIFRLLLLLEERGRTANLFDAYYVRLAQQRTGLRETAKSRTH